VAEGHKDYSGTPLWRKLGIREGSRVLIVGAPEGFRAWLGRIAPEPPDVRLMTRATKDVDVAVVFVTDRTELEPRFRSIAATLRADGGLWIAWPKKVSGVATDLSFEAVQSLGLGAGLVDNKSASIDDTYQGLRFVYRLKDRPR
jgi:hypothetical protein